MLYTIESSTKTKYWSRHSHGLELETWCSIIIPQYIFCLAQILQHVTLILKQITNELILATKITAQIIHQRLAKNSTTNDSLLRLLLVPLSLFLNRSYEIIR